MVVAGWVLVTVGVVAGWTSAVAVGSALAGAAAVLTAKLTLELRTAVDSTTTSVARVEVLPPLLDRLQTLETALVQLERSTVPGEVERVAAEVARVSARVEQMSDLQTSARERVSQLAATADATHEGLTATRAILDKVARRTPPRVAPRLLAKLSATDVEDPLLSIAIPSYNRPAALAECLDSIESELGDSNRNRIEVCITDDASTDPEVVELVAEFAQRCRFASLRVQPTNVGLERNILAACEPCRGAYVLILGNDDKIVPGALATVLDDLRNVAPSVYLVERHRIRSDGSRHPPVSGTDPIELEPGESHVFDSLLEATRRRGFLSTLGFTSHVIFRRRPFVSIDHTAYLDLTLYARVFVLIEAFAREPLMFRNAPIVLHRTPTSAQRHGESLGRNEEAFMAGGARRAARYFGVTLAAALQRLVDRDAFDYAYLADLPERLFNERNLVDWIARNRALDPLVDGLLDPHVVADGDRLLGAFEADGSVGAVVRSPVGDTPDP